ncbi:MAG: hypothetical protein II875_11735 [Clostridia bacterium]|nr:hypothetical protein [Clostridia bacterium]
MRKTVLCSVLALALLLLGCSLFATAGAEGDSPYPQEWFNMPLTDVMTTVDEIVEASRSWESEADVP